ncbi:MAG: hypothetical protein LBF64_06760 [Oscillospiraceae bacterium]|jgi:hypothetical protein|nr:hypothetical protein [Oscillospiraceae bacterium]
MDFSFLRLIVLAGHYGSGKTHLAVNLALHWRAVRAPVALADLDIVNPYYRAKDAAAWLREADIRLISSVFAGSNLDAPAIPSETGQIFDDDALCAVVDVGGDDRGALALGRYAGRIAALRARAAVLWVINPYRPLTGRTDDALAIMGEIEAAGSIRFTGIVNNANLGPETTPEDVTASLPHAETLSRATGLPIALTSVRADLLPAVADLVPNPFPLRIFHKPEWVL